MPKYLSFDDARAAIRGLRLYRHYWCLFYRLPASKRFEEWASKHEGLRELLKIPSHPDEHYKNDGWDGYADFMDMVPSKPPHHNPHTTSQQSAQSPPPRSGHEWACASKQLECHHCPKIFTNEQKKQFPVSVKKRSRARRTFKYCVTCSNNNSPVGPTAGHRVFVCSTAECINFHLNEYHSTIGSKRREPIEGIDLVSDEN